MGLLKKADDTAPDIRSTQPVQWNDRPLNLGPLCDFQKRRELILGDVCERTYQQLSNSQLELLVGEALYTEKVRLKRARFNMFTRERRKRDQKVWGQIQRGLLEPAAMVDRKDLLHQSICHYGREILGNFDPHVYKTAVRTVPLFFNWLLNAASVRRISPWRQTEFLEERIEILGEVSMLQKLSEKGTILMVPTHLSNIDSVMIGYIIYLMSLPPFAYGAGLNLYSNPLLSYFMSRLGAYTVDRQKSSLIYKTTLKNYSTTILEEGVHSIFFPGGGRVRNGALESKLKLGLLGTALEAQINNHLKNKPKPNIYVVPMVLSYHFVLEASSLIEDFLVEAGRSRFLMRSDESWQATKILKFFWKLFAIQSSVTARIGKPMDVFGNFVDEDGRSIGPNNITIDPQKWFTTRGVLGHEPNRDRQYTVELGERIVERFHAENTVLSSHLVAFTLFEALRKQYPELDLYRFLRLSVPQRTISVEKFYAEAEAMHAKVKAASDRRSFYLSNTLMTGNTRSWVEDGIRNLGVFHENAVVKMKKGTVYTEDMTLLYYYRNRLAGYGLSLLTDPHTQTIGQYDRLGFLA